MAKTTKKGAASPAEPFNSNSEIERLVGQFGRELQELKERVAQLEERPGLTLANLQEHSERLSLVESRVDNLEIDECAKSVDTADNAAANAATNAAARAAIRAIVLEVLDEQRRANPLAR